MDEILILGGGGHAGVLVDLITLLHQYNIVGVLDRKLKRGSEIYGYTVLGNDDLLSDFRNKGIKNICIAVGSIKKNDIRKALFEKVKHSGYFCPSLIGRNVIIAEGVQIMAGAIIQTGSIIGDDTIINTGSILEHDSIIGKHVHIGPGSVLSGGCTIGDGTFIGAGSTIIQGITIGSEAVVAAGSVVINNIQDNQIVKGVPAK
jgi:UDP-perosamine 4-acetyltransferase